jgi:hypothetical protein
MRPEREKLTTTVANRYPHASEILVSFPEEWEVVSVLEREREGGDASPLYIAAMPPTVERPGRDHFYGLSPEINQSLTTYRLYRFFQPWPMPTLFVDWNPQQGRGRVVGQGETKINLHPIGQAQTWTGDTFGLIWESYLHEPRRKDDWQDLLADIWQRVEGDTQVEKVFTPSYEPTFEEGYAEFLTRLGYAPEAASPQWWSKTLALNTSRT